MFAKNGARKTKNFAPFRHSGTKNRVIGLENSGVEWVFKRAFLNGIFKYPWVFYYQIASGIKSLHVVLCTIAHLRLGPPRICQPITHLACELLLARLARPPPIREKQPIFSYPKRYETDP